MSTETRVPDRTSRLAKVLVCVATFAVSLTTSLAAHASYDANIQGKVIAVLTYSSGRVMIKLDNQPSSHPTCNPSYFSLPTDSSEATINRMMSRALSAHHSGETLNIGYDSQGDCVVGYIRVHRVG